MADPDQDADAYADEDYEPESPTRSQQAASPIQERQALQFDSDGLDGDDGSESEAGAPLSTTNLKRSNGRRDVAVPSGRHLMDNTPWMYSVWAAKVRMLRIPVAESAAIRELRVFATVDKQAAQSRGSRWKQELQGGGGSLSPLASRRRKKRSKAMAAGELYRRSGLIEEAKWVRGDGKLQWTFPMEKFRRLKAYAPRIKAFVYGINETADASRARPRMDNLAREEKDGEISSFGWFFLDLRTPDLPERWIKLQNSPFGGEILISTTFSPVEISPPRNLLSTSKDVSQVEGSWVKHKPSASTSSVTLPIVASDESGEYLKIGDSNGSDIFVISVFIKAALNLTTMVEAATGESQEELQQTGFWLSYSLFDIVVQTDVFHNLGVAEFAPIRDSFRLQSNLKDLKLLIDALGSITMFMCTENTVLAGVEVPLRSLIAEGLLSTSTTEPKSGDTSLVDGNFSFPEFDEAVITASVEVEFVQSEKPQTKAAIKIFELEEEKQETQAENSIEQREILPIHAKKLFKFDFLRLQNATLAPFAGEENVCIELIVGEERVSGGAIFTAFMKNQAFATNPAIQVALASSLSQSVTDSQMNIRCFLSRSKRIIATSGELITDVEDESTDSKLITLSLLNEAKDVVGECAVRCMREPTAPQKLPFSEPSTEKRHYRICLKLKSVRDVELPGEYYLQYQNPFFGSGSIRSDPFVVQQRGEVLTSDFYCIFDLAKDGNQLKQEMQAALNVDLVSSNGEMVGNSIFSLSYLFFSEERYYCSKETCDEVFMTEGEAEAHWIGVHTESALPDGSEVYAHSYRSCSINIPITSADDESNTNKSTSRRVGLIHVSAYLEDMGVLTKTHVAAKEAIVLLSPHTLQENSKTTQHASVASPTISPVAANTATSFRDRSSSMSMVREAEETSRYTSPTRGSSIIDAEIDGAQPHTDKFRAAQTREREKEAAKFQESSEKERSMWKQEQHLQQLQWKRRFAEMEKARMDELEEEWARREEERSVLLRTAQEEYQRLEQTLRASLADLEARERRLAIAEAALQREQDAKRDENEFLQRRLKREQSHALSLAKKQSEAYEKRVTLLESQLSDTERRAKQVESDFAEYRQQQRKLPESRMREEIAALRGSVAELEKQKMAQERECEIAEAKVEKMKLQLEHMAKLVQEEKKKHEARVVDELEKLRVKYIAREEKYVLDGDRDELRAIKKQLDDLKGINLREGRRKKRSTTRQRSIQSTSPQIRQDQGHMRSHQSNRTRDNLLATQYYHSPGPSSYSDRVSDDDGDWEELSYVEAGSVHITAEAKPAAQRDASPPRQQLFTAANAEELTSQQLNDPTDSELERLTRERKLLLTSGAYDADSYLVRELDRLISITRANAEHKSS